jgi:hypothetical protein
MVPSAALHLLLHLPQRDVRPHLPREIFAHRRSVWQCHITILQSWQGTYVADLGPSPRLQVVYPHPPARYPHLRKRAHSPQLTPSQPTCANVLDARTPRRVPNVLYTHPATALPQNAPQVRVCSPSTTVIAHESSQRQVYHPSPLYLTPAPQQAQAPAVNEITTATDMFIPPAHDPVLDYTTAII